MTYILPRLPYERSALEPHSDARTMALHHENHSAFWFSLSPLGGGRPSGALSTWNNITDSLFRAKDD